MKSKFSSSRFCLTQRREAAKVKMVFFAFFAASREIREVLMFYLPRLRQTLVYRPRLLNQLQSAVQRLLTLVSAPGGIPQTGFCLCAGKVTAIVDVSTPLTRERYTRNWMGAMQARKPNANMIRALFPGVLSQAWKDCTWLVNGWKLGEASQHPLNRAEKRFRRCANTMGSGFLLYQHFSLANDSRMCYHLAVNKRQRETLVRILQTPVPTTFVVTPVF